MEVHLDLEDPPMGRNNRKSKPQRPKGRRAPAPADVAAQTGRMLTEREHEWLERLTRDPASFAAVELEVHEQARRQADFYVAGRVAEAREPPETTPHIDKVIAETEGPLRPVEKKQRPDKRLKCRGL